jgi:hypothetical protein
MLEQPTEVVSEIRDWARAASTPGEADASAQITGAPACVDEAVAPHPGRV